MLLFWTLACAPEVADSSTFADLDEAGARDFSTEAPDTGLPSDTADTGVPSGPLDGFGELTGDCWMLDDEWSSDAPYLFQNTLDLPGKAADDDLSEGGAAILAVDNLGGSSVYSEVFAFEVLYRCEGASLLATETEIDYVDKGGKKTDILTEIDGHKVGVSVVRAFQYPPGTPMSQETAEELLEGKLSDILLSADNAADTDAWDRSVLSVLAWDEQHAEVVANAFADLDDSVLDETIVVMTVTEGTDELLY